MQTYGLTAPLALEPRQENDTVCAVPEGDASFQGKAGVNRGPLNITVLTRLTSSYGVAPDQGV